MRYSKQPDGSWTIDPPHKCVECGMELSEYMLGDICMDCMMRHAEERPANDVP